MLGVFVIYAYDLNPAGGFIIVAVSGSDKQYYADSTREWREQGYGLDMQVFELDGHEYIQLNDLLKITGLCNSGGQAKLLIDEGLVKVDGKVETRKRCKVRVGQVVEFSGEQVEVK